jgi:hypothetical protein
VRFPDGYILEADFLPSERIHSLVDLLMKVLARPDLPFYLCKFCFSFRDDVECKYHVFLFSCPPSPLIIPLYFIIFGKKIWWKSWQVGKQLTDKISLH